MQGEGIRRSSFGAYVANDQRAHLLDGGEGSEDPEAITRLRAPLSGIIPSSDRHHGFLELKAPERASRTIFFGVARAEGPPPTHSSARREKDAFALSPGTLRAMQCYCRLV